MNKVGLFSWFNDRLVIFIQTSVQLHILSFLNNSVHKRPAQHRCKNALRHCFYSNSFEALQGSPPPLTPATKTRNKTAIPVLPRNVFFQHS
jgi:hypothetical protein